MASWTVLKTSDLQFEKIRHSMHSMEEMEHDFLDKLSKIALLPASVSYLKVA